MDRPKDVGQRIHDKLRAIMPDAHMRFYIVLFLIKRLKGRE